MKPENRLIQNVHKHLPDSLHREKMANPYRRGMADCWYSGPRDLWVEWKWLKALPKRANTVIKPAFEPLQESWCTNREQEGRQVMVIVGSPAGCILFRSSLVWSLGVPRGEAQLISKQQTAEAIARACGLEFSAGQHLAPSKSTRQSSSRS